MANNGMREAPTVIGSIEVEMTEIRSVRMQRRRTPIWRWFSSTRFRARNSTACGVVVVYEKAVVESRQFLSTPPRASCIRRELPTSWTNRRNSMDVNLLELCQDARVDERAFHSIKLCFSSLQ